MPTIEVELVGQGVILHDRMTAGKERRATLRCLHVLYRKDVFFRRIISFYACDLDPNFYVSPAILTLTSSVTNTE